MLTEGDGFRTPLLKGVSHEATTFGDPCLPAMPGRLGLSKRFRGNPRSRVSRRFAMRPMPPILSDRKRHSAPGRSGGRRSNDGQRFDFEWVSCWTGWFESKSRCHGFDHDAYVGWMRNRLAELGPLEPGERILDAGCGSGEKTRVLAELCPVQQVVGLDLGIGALERASAQFGTVKNLDYVQGNILQPPFREKAFRWGISIGMLHHTPDTRRAFAAFRKLLADDPAVLIWIYRPFWDAPEMRLMYFCGDVLFLGQSPKLPPRLTRFRSGRWRHVYRWPTSTAAARTAAGQDLPFFRPGEMTFGEGFTVKVFHLFDTLLPRYQFRHTPREVEGWFEEEGIQSTFHVHSYYLAGVPGPA